MIQATAVRVGRGDERAVCLAHPDRDVSARVSSRSLFMSTEFDAPRPPSTARPDRSSGSITPSRPTPWLATQEDPNEAAVRNRRRAARQRSRAQASGNGVRNALRIVLECRHRHNGVIPVSLGLALQEQESGGLNIFGADEQRAVRASARHQGARPEARQPRSRRWHLQRCRPDAAHVHRVHRGGESDGGAWEPAVNLATGLGIIAGHVKQHGVPGGLATFNAGSPQSSKGRRTHSTASSSTTTSTNSIAT